MESINQQIKNIEINQVGVWFDNNLISPFLQGFFTGASHLLILTILIKYLGK